MQLVYGLAFAALVLTAAPVAAYSGIGDRVARTFLVYHELVGAAHPGTGRSALQDCPEMTLRCLVCVLLLVGAAADDE